MKTLCLLALFSTPCALAAEESAPVAAPAYAGELPAPARLVAVRPLPLPEDCVVTVPKGTEGATPQGFSRAPRAPYTTDFGSVLVFESLVPSPCSDGVWYFVMEQVSLSADGRTLLMTIRRLPNTAPAGTQPSTEGRWDDVRRYESDVPCTFRLGKHLVHFTMGGKDGEAIGQCTLYRIPEVEAGKGGEAGGAPAFLRHIYPAEGAPKLQSAPSGSPELWN